ncbi:hypothetical protein CRYO30217_03385 [Parvicella tangerina]|uniref:DUF4270 family protein n=2 Tax=Parvicella tangerina TaxID=2829795 RepID=A0A916NEN6_9FLAO|nr:hypothetical protein CRYO30217_03385 [Parvicella tangerina]
MRNNTFFSKRIAVMLSATFFITGVFMTGCKKKDNELGLGLHPEEDLVGLNTTDTLSLITYNALSDSIVTDELASSNLLGSYVDPFLGKVSSSIYTHIRLEGAVDFIPSGGTINDIAIDSAVLYLDITGFYGTLDEQTFEVYQVTEDFYEDSTYYSNSTLTTDVVNLVASGMGSITPNGDLLSIPLSINDFAQPIVNQSGTGVLDGNDGDGEFIDWFKGLYIKVNNSSQMEGEGAILYLDLESSASRVTLFYRDTLGASTEHDTLEFDFNINSSCARFSNFNQDYTGTMVDQVLNDSTIGQETFFSQTMGGVRAKVDIPHALNLLDSGNIIVNKAELVLPVQYYSGDPLYPPDLLYLVTENDEGGISFIPDYNDSPGGNFDDDESSYTFNITRYYNQLISGEIKAQPLTIVSSGNAVSANRVVFNGPETILKDKPKVVITYSKYE